MQELYNNWMLKQEGMEWTVNGNPRPPSMDVYLEWISVAWDSLSKESIKKLLKVVFGLNNGIFTIKIMFLDCGIMVCHDGSEHVQIHCFKPHGPVSEGRVLLQEARAGIQPGIPLEEDIDEEQDEENGYSSDESIEFKIFFFDSIEFFWSFLLYISKMTEKINILY
jgi:hypothetical protein